MTGYIVIFIVGFLLGVWLRGGFAKSRIGQLKNEAREAEIVTRIEQERVKQHRMLDERTNS